MSARHDHKEREVVRLLAGAARPRVPRDLPARVLAYGARVRRRQRWRRRALWLLLAAGAVAFAVWAYAVEPWAAPPMRTTPPLEPW
ncbi:MULTISPECIES: hypothetical protein [unclassified Streptomyces]|uniref:hypothetical protein n=1 Tax=unclassified Streptomyces TaxID=2593676 RepID=UPI003331DA20